MAFVLLAMTLIGGGVLWWFFLATYGERLIASWIDDQRRDGYDVRTGPVSRSGFPFQVVLELPTVHILRASGDQRLEWRGDGLRLQAAVWSPRDIEFALQGRHQAEFTIPEGARPARGRVATGNGRILPNPEAPGWRIVARVTGFDVRLLDGEFAPLTAATANAVVDIPPKKGSGEARIVRAKVDGTDILLPQPTPLGQRIASLNANVAASAPLPGDLDPASLALWRDRGGTAYIDALQVAWGPLGVGASGELRLDQAFRPSGHIDARVRGFEETVDALVTGGVIEQKTAPTLKLVLNLLAQGSDQKAREVPARLHFQEGWFFVGPAKIAPLSPVCDCPS